MLVNHTIYDTAEVLFFPSLSLVIIGRKLNFCKFWSVI